MKVPEALDRDPKSDPVYSYLSAKAGKGHNSATNASQNWSPPGDSNYTSPSNTTAVFQSVPL
jgi:hypothetical protein